MLHSSVTAVYCGCLTLLCVFEVSFNKNTRSAVKSLLRLILSFSKDLVWCVCGHSVWTMCVHTECPHSVDTPCGAGKEPSERNVCSSYQGSVTSVSCLNLLSPPRVLSKVGSLFQLLWGETMTGTVTCRGQHLITAFVHTVCSACTLL